jgi:hypothetical protein
MHETADDLIDLQNLLDESDALSGQHLREVITRAAPQCARNVRTIARYAPLGARNAES